MKSSFLLLSQFCVQVITQLSHQLYTNLLISLLWNQLHMNLLISLFRPHQFTHIFRSLCSNTSTAPSPLSLTPVLHEFTELSALPPVTHIFTYLSAQTPPFTYEFSDLSVLTPVQHEFTNLSALTPVLALSHQFYMNLLISLLSHQYILFSNLSFSLLSHTSIHLFIKMILLIQKNIFQSSMTNS